MANRNRSDRDRDRDRNQGRWQGQDRERGENFGGSRREQNFNEYGGQYGSRGSQFSGAEADFGGGYNQGFGSFYSPGQAYNQGNFGGGQWNQERGQQLGQNQWNQGGSQSVQGRWNEGSDQGRENIGRHFGGGRGDFDRYSTGRDFMTNQPRPSSYGDFDDNSRRGYSAPNRDFSERGGFAGSSYGNYSGSRGWGMDFDRGEGDFDSGRTSFDETIAGRPYYGQGRNAGYERENWRAYGSRPSTNREDFRGRDFFNSDYGSTELGGNYDYNRDRSRSFDRERNDYGSGEGFGEKVKSFFGLGPKGYRRSDDRIREDISERLEDHPRVDASNIEVQVRDGEVTLAGTVPDRNSKRLAEDICEQCRGVKDIHNQIRVQQTGSFGESGKTGSSLGDLSSASPTSGTSGTSGPTTGTTSPGGKKSGSERAA